MSNMVAQKLTNLLDAEPDLTSQIRLGRFVKADGSLTNAYSAPADHGTPGHFLGHAVAIWLAAPGSTTLNAQPGRPDSGTIVALPRIGSFGLRRVNSNGDFMDFDGADQPGGLPDIMTRGMLVKSRAGNVARRYYVNVYPALTVTGQLGASRLPPAACRAAGAARGTRAGGARSRVWCAGGPLGGRGGGEPVALDAVPDGGRHPPPLAGLIEERAGRGPARVREPGLVGEARQERQERR